MFRIRPYYMILEKRVRARNQVWTRILEIRSAVEKFALPTNAVASCVTRADIDGNARKQNSLGRVVKAHSSKAENLDRLRLERLERENVFLRKTAMTLLIQVLLTVDA